MDYNEITKNGLSLINNQEYGATVDYIDHLHQKYPEDTNLNNVLANLSCWLCGHTNDILDIERSMYFAKISIQCFDQYLSNLVATKTDHLGFVIPIMQPKSGGTFIFSILHKQIGYHNQIFYAFGDSSHAMFSIDRLMVVAKYGHVLSHHHPKPNYHNLSVLKKANIPIWIHLRDPRDAFFSFLNMYLNAKDKFRKQFDTKFVYNNNTNTDFWPTVDTIYDRNFLAQETMWMMDWYCDWIRGWLDFEYERKIITQYNELQSDEMGFLSKVVCDILGNSNTKPIQIPNKNFINHRFVSGKSGLWRNSLSKYNVDLIESKFYGHGMDRYFDS